MLFMKLIPIVIAILYIVTIKESVLEDNEDAKAKHSLARVQN